MAASDFEGKTFTAPSGRGDRLAEAAALWVEPDADIRVLDLGCGAGRQLLEMAKRFPRAKLTGIDLSETNIKAARMMAQKSGLGNRIEFLGGDYMTTELQPFDLIVSDSTLHLIESDDETLARKIVRDLSSNGMLIATMPYACRYNRLLFLLRRALRLFRSRFTDGLIFKTARLLHEKKYPAYLLRERVAYMYIVPPRLYSGDLIRTLNRSGLVMESVRPLPHDSPGQPKHVLIEAGKRL